MRTKSDDLPRGRASLANHGGQFRVKVDYTDAELKELLNWALWKDPLKHVPEHLRDRTRWFDGSNEKPILPNWAYLRRRNLWVCHYAGITLELAPALTGNQWILYLEGEQQLGDAGDFEVLKEKGTGLLLMAMLAKEQGGLELQNETE